MEELGLKLVKIVRLPRRYIDIVEWDERWSKLKHCDVLLYSDKVDKNGVKDGLRVLVGLLVAGFKEGLRVLYVDAGEDLDLEVFEGMTLRDRMRIVDELGVGNFSISVMSWEQIRVWWNVLNYRVDNGKVTYIHLMEKEMGILEKITKGFMRVEI